MKRIDARTAVMFMVLDRRAGGLSVPVKVTSTVRHLQ